ncbi:hypothetical protein JCM10207_002540 [Rhodosporidiobolus poonsookiae]
MPTAHSLFLPTPSSRFSPSPSSNTGASSPPPASQRTKHAPRLRKGTRAQDAFNPDPFSPLPRLADFDSAFAVQEYIAVLVRRDPLDVELITAIPTSAQDDDPGKEGEEGEEVELVDEDVWVFEQLRRLTLDQHLWLAALSSPSPSSPSAEPPCSPLTCPTMSASDWLFLCAAHAPSSQPSPPCSALDYIHHASDGAQALLCSSRYFPSRLSVPPPEQGGRRLLDAVARRLYRSFAHAFYHHPTLFASLESETALVRRFAALTRRFGLVDPEALIIPELGEAFGDAEEGWEGGEGGEERGEEGEMEGEEGGIREVS